MFRDKIREILELVLKAEEKNIYVAYNYDTNTKTLTIITKTRCRDYDQRTVRKEIQYSPGHAF